MDGVSFTLETKGLESVLSKLQNASALNKHELMDGLGRLGQQQTKKRIEIEKTTPAGAAWPKTRDGRGALFVTGTHLARSIDYSSGESEARWGSGWIGARVHQFGATIVPKNAKALVFMAGGQKLFRKKATIPARPYVGLSEANKTEMISTAETFLGKVLP